MCRAFPLDDYLAIKRKCPLKIVRPDNYLERFMLCCMEQKRCHHKENVKNGGNLRQIERMPDARGGKGGSLKRGERAKFKTGNQILWLGETAGNVQIERRKGPQGFKAAG